MPVPSSLEMLDPTYAKTIRIIVQLECRYFQSRDHIPPYWNYHYDWIGRIVLSVFECTILLNCDCERLAIFFKDRKNYWNYRKSFQCRGGNGNRSKLKDCLAKRNEVRIQTTRLYYACGLVFISRFMFVRILFFFSSLSWCLSNYFCTIVMRWLYNEFFFYVEIVVLFNDLVKVDTSKKVYCVMSWSLKKYLKSFLCDFFK